jgi:phosphatidylglycerophosphate synthase
VWWFTVKLSEFKKFISKNGGEPFLYSRLVGRNFSVYFSFLFIKMNIQPNTITFISLVSALISCVCMSLSFISPLFLLIAILFINIYHILDHSDGEVARYYIAKKGKTPSKDGEYFDYIVHYYSTNLMFFCMGLGLYFELNHNLLILLFGFVGYIGMSNFHNLALSHVLLANVNRKPDFLKNSEFINVLSNVASNVEAQNVLNSNSFIKKLIQLIKETLTFPGCMGVMSIVLFLDFVFESRVLIFRELYLYFIGVFFILNSIRGPIVNIFKLKKVY